MENGLSASDVALMNRDTGFGGEAFMWIFALLILAGGGFGGFGGYGNGALTQDAMQNGFNFNDLQDQNRDIMNSITSGTAQSVAATNQTFHDTLGALNDKYSELARDISMVNVALQQAISNQNECCCSTKMEIAQNRYEAALNTSAINANTTAQIQSVKDMMAQNKIEALQAQINALELQNAVAGVVRYPNAWVYDAGKAPFCTCTTTPTTGA
jgi:hypothetical protein